MNTLAAISFGYFLSSVFSNPTTALQMSPMLAMPLMLVGGFFSNQGTMPVYIEVFSHISPINYAFNNLARLQLEKSDSLYAKIFLEFIGIDRTFWDGILYLGILILSLQVLSVIFLKVLITKFQ